MAGSLPAIPALSCRPSLSVVPQRPASDPGLAANFGPTLAPPPGPVNRAPQENCEVPTNTYRNSRPLSSFPRRRESRSYLAWQPSLSLRIASLCNRPTHPGPRHFHPLKCPSDPPLPVTPTPHTCHSDRREESKIHRHPPVCPRIHRRNLPATAIKKPNPYPRPRRSFQPPTLTPIFIPSSQPPTVTANISSKFNHLVQEKAEIICKPRS